MGLLDADRNHGGGYDESDVAGVRAAPTQAEIDASVAATIYSLWRGQALAAVVDGPLTAAGLGAFLPVPEKAMTALRRLLGSNGVGASGFVFFAGPDQGAQRVSARSRARSTSLRGPAFAPAFGGSTSLADYRWGELHRITFAHPLGPAFSLPPQGGLTDLAPGLPGVATDGGFAVVDASSHNPRASTLNGFRFASGPARRFVAETLRSHPHAAVPGDAGRREREPVRPYFGNQLPLADERVPPGHRPGGEIERDAIVREEFRPAG